MDVTTSRGYIQRRVDMNLSYRSISHEWKIHVLHVFSITFHVGRCLHEIFETVGSDGLSKNNLNETIGKTIGSGSCVEREIFISRSLPLPSSLSSVWKHTHLQLQAKVHTPFQFTLIYVEQFPRHLNLSLSLSLSV